MVTRIYFLAFLGAALGAAFLAGALAAFAFAIVIPRIFGIAEFSFFENLRNPSLRRNHHQDHNLDRENCCRRTLCGPFYQMALSSYDLHSMSE